jgi:phage shock protein PspC (stress-responsive transcriptional regulator)
MDSNEKQLRRSAEDRMVGGVAGGIGEFFGIDPTVVRVGWIPLMVAGGSGVLLYVIMWAVIPDVNGYRSPVPILLLAATLLPLVVVMCCAGASAFVGMGQAALH